MSPSQQPNLIVSFEVSPTLASLQVHKETYRRSLSNAQTRVRNVVSSCIIFQNQTVLLIERRTTYPNPRYWEIPGGICDATDETLLHSAARETLEETGLHVKSFNHQVGTGYPIRVKSGTQMWMKVVFDANVAEAESVKGNFDLEIPETCFRLSREHRKWMWVTEEQVRIREANGRHLNMKPVERELVLDGFALRRAATNALINEDVVMQDAPAEEADSSVNV